MHVCPTCNIIIVELSLFLWYKRMLLFLLFYLAKLWRAQFAIYCCVVIASLPLEFLTLFSAGQNSQSVRNRWALWVCREVPYRIRPKIQRHLRKVSCKCFTLFCKSQSMSNNGRKAGATILLAFVAGVRKGRGREFGRETTRPSRFSRA